MLRPTPTLPPNDWPLRRREELSGRSDLLYMRRGVFEIRENVLAYATGTARHEHASPARACAAQPHTPTCGTRVGWVGDSGIPCGCRVIMRLREQEGCCIHLVVLVVE